MIERKSMIEVYKKFVERANEIYAKMAKPMEFKHLAEPNMFSDIDYDCDALDLPLMFSMQYDLLIDIVQKKSLQNTDTSLAIEKNILCILDEINEFLDMYNSNLPYATKTIEEKFELIDALHFAMQIMILSCGKSMGIDNLGGFTKDNKEAVMDILFDYVENNLTDSYYLELSDKSFEEGAVMIFMQLSEVLSVLNWKYWKTYSEDDAKSLDEVLKTQMPIFKMIIDLFLTYSGSSEKEIVLYYIIKNLENFDRQLRGY